MGEGKGFLPLNIGYKQAFLINWHPCRCEVISLNSWSVIWTPPGVNGPVSITDVFFIILLFAAPAFCPCDAPELFLPSGSLMYVMWVLLLLLCWRCCIVAHGEGKTGHPDLEYFLQPSRIFSLLKNQTNSATVMCISYKKCDFTYGEKWKNRTQLFRMG